MRLAIQHSGPEILYPGLRQTLAIGQGAGRSVPSPLVGEGQGGGDCRTPKVGVPPTPNPSPQGGGESAQCLCPAFLRYLPSQAQDARSPTAGNPLAPSRELA